MKSILIASLLLYGMIFPRQKIKGQVYDVINDITLQENKNLSIYFEFDVSTDWASILEGKTLLTLGFDCTTDTKMYNWLHDLDWVSTNSELKRPEEIEKKKIDGGIRLSKKRIDKIVIYSKPIIQGNRAVIYQKKLNPSTSEYILFLEKKNGTWKKQCQFLLYEVLVVSALTLPN